jgi:diguanylate cyclase (GGDEF)-like protein/PAS domain S-box-containing protein
MTSCPGFADTVRDGERGGDAVGERQVELQAALVRAEALTALAMSQKPLTDLLQQAAGLAADLLPGTAVGIYTVLPDASGLTLAASAGGAVPSALPLPDDAPDTVAIRGDNGEPVGQLLAEGPALDVAGRLFIRRLADVIAVCWSRSSREEELIRSERRFVEAQRISHVGSYDFEIASNTNTWSDQLYRIYGREPQSFMASYERFLALLHPDDREHVMAVHQRSLETLEPFEMEERVVWPDGQVRTLASWGEIVADAEGVPTRMVGICWDITERREIEEQLVQQALHDRLTGLPNRALFVDRLGQALEALPRMHGALAVLFIDLDRFKVINDSLGHEAGDAVLSELARRLTAAMRPGDTVARFGGDEFVVLCEGLDHPAEAVVIAQRLHQDLSLPVSFQGSELVVTVSTGIAMTTSEGTLPSDLLRDADAAMYRAKQDGRARSVVFADAMRAQALGRLDTEMELRRALGDGDLRLLYQPLVELDRGEVVGAEALVRWQHATRGLIGPNEFITIAEETGLVVPLGEWVLEEACRQLACWQRQGRNLSMAVNLSGLQIVQPDFAQQVAAILQRTGVDSSALTLEITESVLMRDAEETMEVLRALKQLGVQLSVDDFGTGYSSLSYLKRFPVDVLKIDRSFVDGLADDPDDVAIVQAILALAASLGMSVVAEGVETRAQLEVLKGLGCTRAQGFAFSRPVAAADLVDRPEYSLVVPMARVSQDDREKVVGRRAPAD